MPYSWKQLTTQSRQRSGHTFLSRPIAFLKAMRPGDQAIVCMLSLGVLVTLLSGVYALERAFLITQPAYGGSYTEGVVGHPRFAHPLLAVSEADRDLARLTYAGLMGVGEEGALRPVLAERYEVSEDGRVYTFVIRENAQFSDGTPVSADDVVYTVQRAQDPQVKSPEFPNWSGVVAEAVDARTVRFTLPRAYAPFLEDTTLGILPARLWREVAGNEFPFAERATRPVGAGPFTVEDIRRDKEGTITSYTLRANPRYVLGRPYLSRITLKFYDEETDLAAAYRRKDIDGAYGIPSATAIRVPYARVFGVFFNQASVPAFSDLQVRQALSRALDRNAISTTVLGGYAEPLNGPVPPGSGIEVTPPPESENRIAEAASLLEAAGWTYDQEQRLWTRAGETLRITLRTSNVPELKLVAQQVQNDWAALGVPTSLELFEPGDLTQAVIRPRSYDAILFGMVVGRERDLFAFWHSTERADPGLNIALYSDPEADRLLSEIRIESDPAVRLAKLAELERVIAEDQPAAFTHTPEFVYSIPRNLSGVTLVQIASPSDRFAAVSSWYRHTESVWPVFARK